MSEPEIYEHLAALFAETFPGRTIGLHRDLVAADVPGWDSSRHLNLILGTETTFGIRLSYQEIDGIRRLGDLVDLIRAKTSGSHSGE